MSLHYKGGVHSVRIFLSYTHSDTKRALEIAEILENVMIDMNMNFSVWIDRNNLRISDNWYNAIFEQIEVSDLFVILHSEQYFRNPGGFISRERNYIVDVLNRKDFQRKLLIICDDATPITGPLSFFHHLNVRAPDFSIKLREFFHEIPDQTTYPEINNKIKTISFLVNTGKLEMADNNTSALINYIFSKRQNFSHQSAKNQFISRISDIWSSISFGISEQKKIWDSINDNHNRFEVFSESVNWRSNGRWLEYPFDYKFINDRTYRGHLPTYRLVDNSNPNWFLSWKRRFIDTMSNI